MEQTLLVCKHLYRTKFEYERYQGNDDILALVEKGSFRLSDGTGEVTVSELEAVCFKAGKLYERYVTEPVILYLFRYRGGNSCLPSGKLTFRDRDRVRSTIRLLQGLDSGNYQDEHGIREALFWDLINQYRLENPADPQNLESTDPVIAKALTELQSSLHKKVDLRALAEKYYLSYVQFSRRFKVVMDMTPQEYITDLRLKKAKTLLADSDLTVKEIARSCGFANEYYFSNFFHKHLSMAPSAFRKMEKTTEKL